MMNKHLFSFLVTLVLLSPLTLRQQWKDYVRQLDSTRGDIRVNQIQAESNWNAKATSFIHYRTRDTLASLLDYNGAAGLSQFMWRTAHDIDPKAVLTTDTSNPYSIYNPIWSLNAHVEYMGQLRSYLTRNHSSLRGRMMLTERYAVAGYNCGIGRVSRVLKRKGCNWWKVRFSLPAETRHYVQKIFD